MACYISFDGGGTKLNGMMFDENLNLLGTGRSGGINLSQTSLEDCCANVRDCLDQVLAGHEPEMVDVLYYTGVGNFQPFPDFTAVCAVYNDFAVPGKNPVALSRGGRSFFGKGAPGA